MDGCLSTQPKLEVDPIRLQLTSQKRPYSNCESKSVVDDNGDNTVR